MYSKIKQKALTYRYVSHPAYSKLIDPLHYFKFFLQNRSKTFWNCICLFLFEQICLFRLFKTTLRNKSDLLTLWSGNPDLKRELKELKLTLHEICFRRNLQLLRLVSLEIRKKKWTKTITISFSDAILLRLNSYSNI